MSDKIKHQIIIPPADHAGRVDQILAKLLPEYSRTQIKTWIDEGSILLNDQPIKAKHKVIGGEVITINAEAKAPLSYQGEDIPLNIIYEDDSIIVINKPVGMVVHPGAGNKDQTLLNALLHHEPALAKLPRAGIVHRLDKNTSGLLVIGKTMEAVKSLTQQLKKRSLVREYQAVVNGKLISGGTIDAPIGRHPVKRTQMAVTDTGKEAITHYRVLEKYPNHTLLKCTLATGRTHQIRVHLAHIHHPIVGDMTYLRRLTVAKGASSELKEFLRHYKHQALHAFALGLQHPKTKQSLNFQIELPNDMQQLIDLLRNEK